uniref:Lens epithelium-derived growth factor integrase-binding domain-containing protein n=1 Tax=Rhodnius prolixus TaxID=13249 RepID=T1I253_RHOPR
MGEIENDTSDEDTSLSTNSTEAKLDETHDRFGKRKTKIIKNIELEIVLNRLEKNLVDNVQNRNISSDSNLPESNEDSQKDSASSDGVDCDEVDEIDDSDDCIFAEVGNEKVKIPLNLNQPEFTSEKSKAEWYKYVTVHANSLKNRIEGGEELDPIDEMDGWTMMKEMEHQTNYDLLGQESEICNILLMEGHLLDIDLHLRRSLNTMDPDFDACFLLFDHLINLPIMAIMLKKHPHIVAYIDELRCYVSSIYPELTSDELKQRIDKSEIVRLKSEMAMAKFSEIFHVNRAYFMEKFIREVEKLRIRTCTLSEEEFYFLSEDPE